MKRPRPRRTRPVPTRSNRENTSSSSSSSSSIDTDDQLDATYETDLTEPEDTPTVRKRPRPNETSLAVDPALPDKLGELYEDPLDDTGIDLSEIPEDFDKAEGTILRQERIETRWKQYCISQTQMEPNEPKWREPEEALRQASNNNISLETDWKNFRGYYQKITKIKINDDDGSEVRRGMKYLVQENRLDTQPGKKTPVYIKDISPLNETILSTQQKKFYLRFQRIHVCLFNSLAIFTVHRRSTLLSLQFKDLQISLQKDPRGGPPIPLIELTPEGTKKTTFALPEVIYGPSLVLCPHTLLFGILFYAGAFRNQNLTSKARLRKLFISKGCQQLLLPLDQKKANWYVFCKTELVKGVPTIQRTQQISKSAISTMLITFREIRGWPRAFHAHQFRYRSGKVINKSGWVSKEQYMLIMKHTSPRTFLNHYYPLQLNTDMIRIICGLDPDVELMRAVTRQNHWQDARRPRYLTDQQKAQVEDHPKLKEAHHNLSKIHAQYNETQQSGLSSRIQQLEKKMKNTQKQLLRTLRHQVRENFDKEQAFLDIEAQLSGTAVKEKNKNKPSFKDDIDPLQLWNRRDMGTDAVMQYCDFPEGDPLRGRPKRETSGSATSESPLPDTLPVQNAVELPVSARDEQFQEIKNHLKSSPHPEACFQYFTDEKLPDGTRFRKYHDAGCITRHFNARHLREEPLKCN